MKVVEIGNLRETRVVTNAECDRMPRCGIIIEATQEELATLPFNPVYAEVSLVPKYGQKAPQNARAGFDR